MPDQRSHRGAHPEDAALFAPDRWSDLRAAVADLSWLLTRDYAGPGALKLVGDRYSLSVRQRTAVMRAACSDQARTNRLSRVVASVRGEVLLIDGYNVLTTIEAALGGGVLLLCRDQTVRDMASIHGTYRKVEETIPALHLAGQVLPSLAPAQCTWLLDAPVSNSGRLKGCMEEVCRQQNWPWRIELVQNPDRVLAETPHIGATADSAILDRCQRWFNLARVILGQALANVRIIDLS